MLILFTASSPLGDEDHIRKLKLAVAVIILILCLRAFSKKIKQKILFPSRYLIF